MKNHMSVSEQAAKRKIEIKRRRAMNKPKRARAFDGAAIGRLTHSWQAGNASADGDLRGSLTLLRARSRDLIRNHDHMRRFISLCVSNVVGPKGFSLQVRGKDRNSGKLDEGANGFLEEDFREWGRDCETSGKLTFTDVCKLFIKQVMGDGEFLAMHVDGAGNDDRYRLQILDPDLLDDSRNDTYTRTGNPIRMGVEYDAQMRPVAYHLRDHHPNDYTYVLGDKKYRRIEADKIIHCYIVERPGQSRGIPAAITAMIRMRNLKGYEEAEVINKRIAASKMGFFTRNGEGVGYEGEVDENDELSMEAEPGVFETLPDGVDFKAFDPTADGTSYADFVKTTLRSIASGLGVNYNTLANDLEGVNYSSIRAGVLEDRELWMAMQEWMVECFLRPVYLHWLRNHLAFNSGIPITAFDKFKAHEWMPRRWSWVDPKKDVEAAIMAIDNGLKTRGQVIRESGLDPETVWKDLAEENARLRELGVLVDATAEEADQATAD